MSETVTIGTTGARAVRAIRRLRKLGILSKWDRDARVLIVYVTKQGADATLRVAVRSLDPSRGR